MKVTIVDAAGREEELSRLGSIPRLLDKEDSWNADWFGLPYKTPPDGEIFHKQLKGRRKERTRATGLACCNAARQQKLPIIFIGPPAKVRCFNKTGPQELGFDYHNNSKS